MLHPTTGVVSGSNSLIKGNRLGFSSDSPCQKIVKSKKVQDSNDCPIAIVKLTIVGLAEVLEFFAIRGLRAFKIARIFEFFLKFDHGPIPQL